MKISFKYGDSVINLPAKAAEMSVEASKEDLLVLISLAADKELSDGERAERLGISEYELDRSVSFWRGAGILSVSGGQGKKSTSLKSEKKPKAEKPSGKSAAVPHDESLPHYTSAELARAIESQDVRGMLEFCQQALGRIFNAAESEKVVGLADSLGLGTDYVALLCVHIAEKSSRPSVFELEREAISLYNKNIREYSQLVSYLELKKKGDTLEGKIRKLFGFNDRKLTSKERGFIEGWTDIPFELIEYAYEVTVNSTGKATMPYMNTVLEKWKANSLATVDEVKKADEEFKKESSKSKPQKAKKPEEKKERSFSTDDFFEAALRRSYGDLYDLVSKDDKK